VRITKLFLTSVAALFLATGTAHATDKLPEEMLGLWCQAGVKSEVRKIFFRPSFAERGHCADFDDGITFDENGFSNDSVAVGNGGQCDEYVFDKVERVQDNAYIINAHCGKAEEKYNPAEDNLGGTLHLQIVYDGLLIATKMPEG
jgi:hypothetical protein